MICTTTPYGLYHQPVHVKRITCIEVGSERSPVEIGQIVAQCMDSLATGGGL